MQITGVDHYVLTVPHDEIEPLVAWYRDELGLQPERLDQWRRGEVPFVSLRVSPSTNAQPKYVFRSWSWLHAGSRLPNSVHLTLRNSSRWSYSRRARRPQPFRVHTGCCHSNAIFWAMFGPRPRCVTFRTSTPFVI